MVKNTNQLDKKIMRLTLDEAKAALEAGDYPVASVLVIDGEVIEVLSNKNVSHSAWASHAESLVLQKHSSLIKEKTRKLSVSEEMPGRVELYTTLEPCLMCLGTAVMHKVKRIVYSCPDPRGGVTSLIHPEQLTEFYQKRWPEIVGNVLWEDSYELITTFIRTQPQDFWPVILESFEKMHADLKK